MTQAKSRKSPRQLFVALARGAAVAALWLPMAGVTYGHTDGDGNPLPHATVRVWDTRPLLGFDPDDSVHDIAGLTLDVATALNPLTIATAWENTTCPGGPCGAMLWNPATDDFSCWGIAGGFTASVDLNGSAPVLVDGGGRTYGPGDIWVGGPNSAPVYVKFAGLALARIYFPAGSVWDVLVDQGTGDIWVSSPFSGGFISKIDPTTGAQTRWAVGGQPRELAQDSSGRIYATAGTAGIVRLDPTTNTVRKWAVPGGGLFTGTSIFATPDGIHIDSNGKVWFTQSVSSEIGRLDPVGDVITEYTKPGLSNPQLIATSGSGAKLQAIFTEGSGNSISIVTEVEAVGTDTAVVPVDSIVTPTTHATNPTDRTLSFRRVIIAPVSHDVEGVDGGPDALGTTVTVGPDGIPGNADDERIPGLLRFPLAATGNFFPSGMTGVFPSNTVHGAFLGSDRVFEASSLALIAEPDRPPGAECEDPAPSTQGFWRRVCKKIHPAQADRSFLTPELCEDLNPDPHSDPCERARAQFASVLYNLESERIADDCIVDATQEDVVTTIDEIEALIAEGTNLSCKNASALSAGINEGGVSEP